MILMTGFEPFDGAEVNPSWEAVRLVPDGIGGHAVHRLQLPVEYGRAAALLTEEIRRTQPALVFCCGLAGGRKGVTPELVAINYRHARIPDNADRFFYGDPIDPEGDTAYMTQLPVNGMVSAMQEQGIPAYLSLSAGAYVCNDLYYALLRAEKELGHRGVFIHVPDADTLSPDRVAEALTACVRTALAE